MGRQRQQADGWASTLPLCPSILGKMATGRCAVGAKRSPGSDVPLTPLRGWEGKLRNCCTVQPMVDESHRHRGRPFLITFGPLPALAAPTADIRHTNAAYAVARRASLRPRAITRDTRECPCYHCRLNAPHRPMNNQSHRERCVILHLAYGKMEVITLTAYSLEGEFQLPQTRPGLELSTIEKGSTSAESTAPMKTSGNTSFRKGQTIKDRTRLIVTQ